MAAVVGSKAVVFPNRIVNADRGSFFGYGKMEHAARCLLSNEQFPYPFLERSNPSHPAINIEGDFSRWCHFMGPIFRSRRHRRPRPRPRKFGQLPMIV